MKPKFLRSLSGKILLALLLIQLSMLTLMISNSLRLIREQIEYQIKERIAAVEQAYSTALLLPLVSDDYATLRDILDGLRNTPEIVYLAVSSKDGVVLASSGWDSAKPLPSPGKKDNVYNIAFKVSKFGQEYGQVHYGLSALLLDRAVNALFSQSIVIALLEIILSIALIAITTYLLTRNLHKLANASEQVADGNYDVILPVHGNDEVAVLSANFNSMIAAIRERTETVSFYQKQIEDTNRQMEITIQAARELAKQAEEANNAKRAFLQAVNHELRTPMNGVLGMAQLLSFTTLNSTQQEYLSGLESSADNLLKLITNILDYTAVSEDKATLVLSIFNIHEAIEAVVQIIRTEAERKGLSLKVEYPSLGLPDLLLGDKERLTQVLLHLANNAVKFTETGSVSIKVEILAETEELVQIKFLVKDTGIGIAEEYHSKIFDTFTQADASLAKKHGGTGIGLSISKLMVELMEGQIGVISRKNEGSTFWFSIPLKKAPQ